MKNLFLFTAFLVISFASAQNQGAGKYSIKTLDVNNKYSNFGAAFYGDDQLVFAMPKKGITLVNDVWQQNGQRFLELYSGTITEDQELIDVKALKGEVNTRFHEADVIFTKDKKTVYFTRNNYYNKKLAKDEKEMTNLAMFKATVNDRGEWVNVIPMPFNSVNYSVGHPALSSDEKTLYFVSDMPGSLGQTDIFKVEINDSGFGNPENIGPQFNSSAKEFSPFIDNDVLYFSSDRAGGFGKLDVYAAKIEGFTSSPQLLSEPINSTADDFAYIINSETRKGYFSSNRGGGQGDDDIYAFIEEEPISFKCRQLISGEVRDKNTTEIIQGANISLRDTINNKTQTITVDVDGTFTIPVECETTYALEGSKPGYTSQSKLFTTSNESDKNTKLLILLGTGDILLADDIKPEGMPEVLPEEIVKVRPSTYVVNIDPIYFELNSSYLTKEAKTELDKVVDLMNRYPDMVIESGSHTDSRGIEGYNIWLSDRRAKSTVSYIISNGIDPTRITGKGYGETQLINECSDNVSCSDAQHAMNRRTEFVIIKM